MAETIESFVAKLQADGVQAGQQEAQKIRDDAQAQAGQALAGARAEADKILAAARAEAQSLLARAKTDLELAARDAVLRLREALTRAVQAILTEGARRQLSDPAFLSKILHDLVLLYGQADNEGKTNIRINVTPEMHHKLADYVMGELHAAAQKTNATIELHGTLASAGFEYRVDGATIEVTLDSVVQTLQELVGPELRAVLGGTIAEK